MRRAARGQEAGVARAERRTAEASLRLPAAERRGGGAKPEVGDQTAVK